MSTELQSFLISRANQNCSPKTVDWYRAMLTHFDTWLAANALTVHSVKPTGVDRFLAAMREAGYSPGTIAQFYVALSAYFRWLVRVEILPANPVAKVARPKLPDSIPITLISLMSRRYTARSPVTLGKTTGTG